MTSIKYLRCVLYVRIPRSSLATRIQQRKKKRFSIRAVVMEKQVAVYIGPEQEVAYGSSFVLRRSLLCER